MQSIFYSWCFHSEDHVFSICKIFEGWMGGVWHWIFFSHGFQYIFTFSTVFKTLDRDLHFVQCYIWDDTPTFCVHVIVSNLLWI